MSSWGGGGSIACVHSSSLLPSVKKKYTHKSGAQKAALLVCSSLSTDGHKLGGSGGFQKPADDWNREKGRMKLLPLNLIAYAAYIKGT